MVEIIRLGAISIGLAAICRTWSAGDVVEVSVEGIGVLRDDLLRRHGIKSADELERGRDAGGVGTGFDRDRDLRVSSIRRDGET